MSLLRLRRIPWPPASHAGLRAARAVSLAEALVVVEDDRPDEAGWQPATPAEWTAIPTGGPPSPAWLAKLSAARALPAATADDRVAKLLALVDALADR